MSDPRAKPVMIRYWALLQAIDAIKMLGFATLLDTASPESITKHEQVLAFLESEIARVRGNVTG